jgi:threonine/homoserine/homoserine lactone efflux protein
MIASMIFDFPTRYPEYLVTTVIIVLAPGPSVLFTVARAIAWGRVTAVATVAGNVTGAFVISLIVAFGLGPILQRSEIAFLLVQIAGGLYLIYLGIDAIRHSQVHANEMINQGEIKPSTFRSMRDGFWVGALNPKVLVFFAAILPQFADRTSASVTTQLVLMGATFSVIAFCGDSTFGLIAGTIRQWMANSPARLVFMRRFGGIVMIALGLFTLASAI